ncbi:MAG TPA: twin-arginine translocase TatA/TatE family subunit [Candidatus Limnocylindria bacterium]|jgi:sec-independent protein translocase protein TatA|nr:twin-arginine translocase TatA/TatE family subunit [Candidatus Limnocylindria bacterium]
MLGTTEIALIVGAAVLLFGVDKLPKLARSAGQAKKEFLVGQAEADVAAEKARQDARARAEANVAAATPVTPDPAAGATVPTTPTTTTTARPQE